jgi:hypothetical protein
MTLCDRHWQKCYNQDGEFTVPPGRDKVVPMRSRKKEAICRTNFAHLLKIAEAASTYIHEQKPITILCSSQEKLKLITFEASKNKTYKHI